MMTLDNHKELLKINL